MQVGLYLIFQSIYILGLTVGFDNGRSENLLKSKQQETSEARDSLYFLE